MGTRPALEQAVINNVGLARTLIRKRYSILADEELNEAIPRIRLELAAQMLEGRVPRLSTARLEALLFGEDA
jgi:hypothetical protein